MKQESVHARVEAEIAAAFPIVFATNADSTKGVLRGHLRKLSDFAAERRLSSLIEFSDPAVGTAFEKYLTASTREKTWNNVVRIIRHVLEEAGLEAPNSLKNPWARRAPTWQEDTAVSGRNPPVGTNDRTLGPVSVARAVARSRLATRPIARVLDTQSSVVHLNLDPTLLGTGGTVVMFPTRENQEAHKQNFTAWEELGTGIAQEVALAAIALQRNNSRSTVTTWRRQATKLRLFLLEIDPASRPSSLCDLDAKQLNDFKAFIDRGDVETRGKIWRVATSIIDHTCLKASRPKPYHQSNPWAGRDERGSGRTLIMSISTIASILNACADEMDETARGADGDDFEGIYLDELFPFVTALTFLTLFNPETACGVRLSDIRPDMLGRFAVVGRKGRSPNEQVATFSSSNEHSLAAKCIIDRVTALTLKIRHLLSPSKRDFLFIGKVRQEQRALAAVRPYSEISSMISYHRDAFCKRHGLETFALKDIRSAGGVLCNKLFGGDVKTVQTLMNHLSSRTTDGYVRRASKQVEDERLAHQMEMRLRWTRSDGLRDLRDTPTVPYSAATPGFVCSDPFDPPAHLGQEKGMCAAYGACPTCPLASVDRQCPTTFAHILRLKNQIKAAHRDPEIVPQRWVSVWKPRLEALENRWLPSFRDDVVAEASTAARVALAPLPPISEF